EQSGRTTPLFSLGGESATVTRTDRNHIRITRPLGKQNVPELQAGSARIVVSATRQSFLKLRTFSGSASKDIQVRLEPPRDEAGNHAPATFMDNVFEKPFKRSRIELDDRFLNRVVPEILKQSHELKMSPPAEGTDMLPAFLKVNGELRRINSDQIAALASR